MDSAAERKFFDWVRKPNLSSPYGEHLEKIDLDLNVLHEYFQFLFRDKVHSDVLFFWNFKIDLFNLNIKRLYRLYLKNKGDGERFYDFLNKDINKLFFYLIVFLNFKSYNIPII